MERSVLCSPSTGGHLQCIGTASQTSTSVAIRSLRDGSTVQDNCPRNKCIHRKHLRSAEPIRIALLYVLDLRSICAATGSHERSTRYGQLTTASSCMRSATPGHRLNPPQKAAHPIQAAAGVRYSTPEGPDTHGAACTGLHPRAAKSFEAPTSHPLLQAFRDNHRISLEDPAFAAQLWERCGLRDVCSSLSYNGRAACGLNPNLRLYRHAAPPCLPPRSHPTFS